MAKELFVPTEDAGFQLSRGMVFPLVGSRRTWSQEHLFPIIATILVSLGMMVVLHPNAQPTGADQIQQAWAVYWIIALYIALMINTYIYHMCDRAAAWWLYSVSLVMSYSSASRHTSGEIDTKMSSCAAANP